MAQITRGIDQVEVWDNWYEDSLDHFVEEAKEKGIEIGSERNGKPAISFSGFWSQGDGLAFDADINWPVFFDAHPELKTEYVDWYLLLSANPKYFYTCVRRERRNDLYMQASVSWDDYPDKVEYGFFAGLDVEDELPELYSAALEATVLSVCEDEAHRMHKALEEEHEAQLEYEVELAKEAMVEEYKAALRSILWPLSTTGAFTRADVYHDEVDFADLMTLDLVKGVAGRGWLVSKKGLKVLA